MKKYAIFFVLFLITIAGCGGNNMAGSVVIETGDKMNKVVISDE